jgi:hypothetical protein
MRLKLISWKLCHSVRLNLIEGLSRVVCAEVAILPAVWKLDINICDSICYVAKTYLSVLLILFSYSGKRKVQ